MSESILKVDGVKKSFGGVHALRGCFLEVKRNKIYGLIGPNGSGKTTLFQTISGMEKIDEGKVIFDNEDITGMRPSRIYHKGFARTFQLSRVFPDLTVLENLMVASRRGDKGAEERALNLLNKVNLTSHRYVKGIHLSYGQKRLVEFLRVLMCEPSLILLDEPAAGVNPTLRKVLWELVLHLNSLGATFLIIEHNMKVIEDLCHQVYVMNEGRVIASGTPQEIRGNQSVIEAYFGK
ncbi:MAG: ABC transporter ATP-binding protein [Thermodesulfobacteriota bacterium]